MMNSENMLVENTRKILIHFSVVYPKIYRMASEREV